MSFVNGIKFVENLPWKQKGAISEDKRYQWKGGNTDMTRKQKQVVVNMNNVHNTQTHTHA